MDKPWHKEVSSMMKLLMISSIFPETVLQIQFQLFFFNSAEASWIFDARLSTPGRSLLLWRNV